MKKEQSEQEKEESVQFEEERITRKCDRAKPVLKEIKSFFKSLMLHEIKGVVMSG